MSGAPTISAVMAARNASRTIGQALDALVAQQPPLHEIIVVVDGSDPATLVEARRRSSVIVEALPPVGLGAALDHGARVATGDVIAVTDADDEVQPGWSAALGAALADGADHLACRLAPRGRTPFGERLTRFVAGHDIAGRNGFLPASIGAGQVVRRHLLEQVGGHDPALRSTGDSDLAYRLALAGAPAVACDDAVVAYLTRDDLRSFLRQRYTRAYFGEVANRKYEAFAYHRARAKADRRSLVASVASAVVTAARHGVQPGTDAALDVAALAARRLGIARAKVDLHLGRVDPPARLRPRDAEQRRTATPLPPGPSAVVEVGSWWAGAVLAAQLRSHPDLEAIPPGLATRIGDRWAERCPWAPRAVDEAVAAGWPLHRELAARRLDDVDPATWADAYLALHRIAGWLDGRLAVPCVIEVGTDARAVAEACGLPRFVAGPDDDDLARRLVEEAVGSPDGVPGAGEARAAAAGAWLRRRRAGLR